MEIGERGGWIPVVKQKARQMRSNSWFENQRASLFTLFVDNLPESMVPRKLHDLFNKFGVVKDVFIPQKRRKVTNTRFWFMRYDCSIAADVAEQKANGLWVDDKSLLVKVAEYGKGIGVRQRQKPLPPSHFEPRKANAVAPKQIWHQRTDGRSFAEVTKGADPIYLLSTTIKVDELGNGWLYESMIMRLKAHYSVQQERCVWVSCYGVPLNLWNSDAFCMIGRLWGELVLLNGDVSSPQSFRCGRFKIVTSVMDPINTSLNMECKRRVYPIRVFEEQITEEVSISYNGLNSNATYKDVCSNINGVLPLPAESNLVHEDVNKVVDVALASKVALGDLAPQMKIRAELADGGSLSHVSAVNETRDCVGISNKVGIGVMESSLPAVSQYQRKCNHEIQKGVEAQFVENTQQSVVGTHDTQIGVVASIVHGKTLTPGFIKSLSQPLKERPSIYLEVALGHDPFGLQPIGPSSVGLKPSSKGAISSKGITKSTRLVSIAIPISNHSPELQQPSGIGFVQEAQSVLQLGQRLGLDFKGQESEVIGELTLMKEKDKERLERGKGNLE
ncbi:hypothetical protein ACSBR2_025185 [Camellia fascicularis]